MTFVESAHARDHAGKFAPVTRQESPLSLAPEQTAAHHTPEFVKSRELTDLADEFAYSDEEGAGMRAIDIARVRAVVPHLSDEEFLTRWGETMRLARMCEQYDNSDDVIADIAYHADVTDHVVDIGDFVHADEMGHDYVAFGKAMADEYSSLYYRATTGMVAADAAARAAHLDARPDVLFADRPDTGADAVQHQNRATEAAYRAEHIEADLADPDFGGDDEDVERLRQAKAAADTSFQDWLRADAIAQRNDQYGAA